MHQWLGEIFNNIYNQRHVSAIYWVSMKVFLISRIINFVFDLLQELPNNLRLKTEDLRKIGNEKKFYKLGVGIGQCPVSPAPSPRHKKKKINKQIIMIIIIVFGNSGQSFHKSRYLSFLILSNFASFSFFLLTISLLLTRPSFLQTSISWHF